MKIGLMGLPKSGKTTLFNALTGSDIPVSAYSAKGEPNIAIAKVGDERVTKLSEMYKPKKTTYATVEFIDVVGVSEGSAKDESAWSDLLRVIRNADAIALVLRNFRSELQGDPEPLSDLRKMDDELLLSDLISVEKRIEKIDAGNKKGIKSSAAEERALRRIAEQLNDSKPIRELDLSDDELGAIRGFQFLTLKPSIAILNSSEDNYGQNAEIVHEIGKNHRVIEFAGSFEMELSRLDAAEAEAFMEDMGMSESARDRLTTLAYETLGYISFFTVGPDEVRAWTVGKGARAVEAAGTIHSDLARGFIAAECFGYAELMEAGSEKALKEKGRFRLEGKEYSVKDGDIMNIRFNV